MAESMQGLHRSHRCTEVSNKNIGETVTVMGWVQKRRNLGSLIFIDLRDRSGLLQLVFDENNGEVFEKAKNLRSEFVIAAEGVVRQRSGAVNENMATGDIEVTVNTLRILSEAETPPFPVEEDANTREELRLKYRYLDLRKPSMQKNLMLRSRVAGIVRNYLTENNFCEIETPFLIKPTPEGARDYLVPSRVNEGKFYALPQSPQLFKQLLMVSGMDRYFQIVKCFRDEDLRADRQPEFTQIDCEMSFVEEEDVRAIMEKMIQRIFKEVLNVEVTLPLPVMPYAEAMERYGSDKPDTRFGYELTNISDIVANCGFGVFANATKKGMSVRGINVEGKAEEFTKKQIGKLEDHAKTYKAKGLAWMKVGANREVTSPIAKFFTEEEMTAILDRMNAKEGDLLLFVADKDSVVFDALGQVRLEVARRLDLLDNSVYKMLWVTEFPLFEEDEETGRFIAKHHPFTSPVDEDLDKLESGDKASLRAKAYDIVINGYEVGGGSVRIFNSDVQKRMFSALGLSEEEAYEKFGFLLDAFKYGTPPHAGIAFGMDRLIMILAGTNNIKDVIAFPKNQSAVCPMTNAPAVADEEQLKELSIRVELEDKE